MRLAADCPAHEPGGILNGDRAACNDFSTVRISPGELANILRYFSIGAGDRCGFPIRTLDITVKLLRLAEFLALCGNVFPQLPGCVNSVWHNRSVVLITVSGIFGVAAEGGEHKVIFRKGDFSSVLHNDFCCNPLVAESFEYDIRNNGIVFKFNTVRFQIADQRQNQRFVLIVGCEFQELKSVRLRV